MDLADLSHTVAKYAPLLGGALSGPGGMAIGSIIASVFGSDTNKPDRLQNLIITDPEAAIKLRQIESEHQLELRRMIIQAAQESMRSQQADRDSARQRETSVDNSPAIKRDHTPAVLAYMLTIGVFIALASLFYFPAPSTNQELIIGIVTSLTTVWVGAMGYYHGSSSGSRMKDLGLIKHLHRS
jgi:uncharacterized protein (DUF427 family)